MEFEVRRLIEQDWSLLRSVRLCALRDSPRAFDTAAVDAAQWPRSAWQDWLHTGAVFVATDARTVCGMVSSAPRERGGDRGLAAMWVAPESRGSGVGAELLRANLAWAERDGGECVTLWVSPANAPACRLYAKFGFRPTGLTKRSTHGEVVEFRASIVPSAV